MCDENEVEQLLVNFQAALDALNKVEDVEGLTLKLDTHNKKKLLKKVKNLVSEVYGKVSSIRETVSKAYKKAKLADDNKELQSSCTADLETSVNDAGRYSPVLKRSKFLLNVEKPNKEPDKADTSEAPPDDTSEAPPDTHSEVEQSDQTSTSAEPLDVTDTGSDIIESTPVKLRILLPRSSICGEIAATPEADPLEETGAKETDVLSEGKCETTVDNVLEDNERPKEVVAEEQVTPEGDAKSFPKIKVVDISKLLAPKVDTPKEESPVKGRKSVTFDSSVVVLTSSDEDTPKKNPQEKESSPLKSVLRKTASNTIDLSDSDSKENNEHLKNNKKNTQKRLIANKSSDESDCDHYSGNRRLRRIEKNIKEKFSNLIERRKSRRAEKDKDDSSDDDTSKNRKVRCHGLKEKSLKKRKKGENDGSDGIQKLSFSMALDDTKLKSKVYVPLPRFSCEELPELYEKQKELFEVAKTTSDEGSNKKLTLTIKLNPVPKGKSVDAKEQAPDQSKAINGLDKDTSHSSEDGAHQSVVEENGSMQASGDENGGTEDRDSGVASSRNKNSLQSDSEEETDSVKPSEPTNQEENEESENAGKSRLLSSDSDEDFGKLSNKRDLKFSKRGSKKVLLTDSESESDHVQNNTSNASDSDKESSNQNTPQDESKQSKTRINKRARDSSSDDDDKTTRKHLRKMIGRDSLSETTRKAEQKEKERKARIAEKQRKYNQICEMKTDATVDHVILDFNEKTEKPLLSVDKTLTKQLKPHQVQGIKFMWDACFESLEQARKGKGSGCILAHCMGLGKTLQVITLVHTLLTNKAKTKVEKILVVCPVNTVLNWMHEFKRWIPDNDDFPVYELVTCKTSSKNQERKYIVKCWHENGGVLIIGYNMFRNLSNPDNKAIAKNLRTAFHTGLVDPGPDLVVCDEGHLLKNEKTHLSIAMNRIKTSRRIVLTGTPLQNNLREYWCMVQFIKPNLLGTYKEYMNRFVNPITNGQYTDSTQHDIMVMRRRSHVLHKLLDGVVQRQDYAVLEPYLPPKHEYVLFLKLTELQTKLYKHYMDNFARRGDGSNRTSFLFTDFQELQRICTHPRVLLDKSIEESNKKCVVDDFDTDSEGSLRDFIDDSDGKSTSDEDTSDSNGSCSDASIKSGENKKKKKKGKTPTSRAARVTRAQAAQRRDSSEEVVLIGEESSPKQWWEEYVDKSELDNINHGSKIFTLFQILKECEEIGDKVLVFSQSLYTLNSIEYFLSRIDEATQKGDSEKVGGHTGSWSIGLDYFRLDGSSSCDNRASWCDQFNDPDNTRARLFLISTKAGGLGINLVAANRVIIFDVSWNPSHDIQSIYRVYRFGQTKPTYIYRFVTYGAMEMKIYERQVTKQAISKRVIDEQQIDRHYSQNDIQELYKTDLAPEDRPIPLVPKDVLLGEMLQVYDKVIFKYHEHQSLLEDKQDEQLNEDERKAAWDEFENEKVIRKTAVANFAGMYLGAANQGNEFNFSPQMIQMALANMVRKDNPHWTQAQIKNILPGLVAQLQIQLSQNNFSLYNKVQQELRMMQALQAQRMRDNMMKQYHMQQMLQQNSQQLTNQLLGNLNITPEELRLMQMAHASQSFMQPPQPGRSNEIIDLNN